MTPGSVDVDDDNDEADEDDVVGFAGIRLVIVDLCTIGIFVVVVDGVNVEVVFPAAAEIHIIIYHFHFRHTEYN